MSFLKGLFGKKKSAQAPETDLPEPKGALPDAVDAAVKAHCAAGDVFADRGDFADAIAEYNKAWALLPEPKPDWNASTWVLAAIADASFLRGDMKAAREALEFAIQNCPDALGNPFLHLRYGQVLFGAGEDDRAADELMRAYMGAGPEIFDAEDDKYLDFLKTKADGL